MERSFADNINAANLQSQIDIYPRYKQIYQYLLNEISSENLKPGDKIPSEKELCEAFQVSRITSKKALELLVANHLVSRQRGKGTFVANSIEKSEIKKETASFKTIAFLISAFNASFGNRLIRSVQAACEAHGYNMILKLTNDSSVDEENALRALDNENVAGILIIPVHGKCYNAELLRQILKNRPLVFVDRKMRGLPVPSVSSDCKSSSEMAVKWLFNQGHKNIAFYSGKVFHTSTVEDRKQGYTRAFSSSGVPIKPTHICDNLPSLNSIDIITKHLTEHPKISAAFTAEFEIALLVRKALISLGRYDMEKFSLITFDCPPYAEEFPEIICLKQDEEALGKKAVEMLCRIIDGEIIHGDTLIPIEIIAGEKNSFQ